MAPHIFPRQATSATTTKIAGGLIAGFICLIVLLCLLCFLRFHRSRANKKQSEEGSASSFDRVPPTMTETNPLSSSIPIFSRSGLTASIAMPKKTITPKPSSHRLADKAAISSKLESSLASAVPRPLSNSFNLSRPHSMSNLNPARSRQSISSTGSTTSTFSMSLTRARPVRQLFDPVLPDELSLLRYREHLTVLRSFDDGWCLVARDTSRRSSRVSRLSALMKSNGDNVDIGLVPAWVFIKPVKGIAVTRPVRTSSVNALDISQNPPPAHLRDNIVSWSNFS